MNGYIFEAFRGISAYFHPSFQTFQTFQQQKPKTTVVLAKNITGFAHFTAHFMPYSMDLIIFNGYFASKYEFYAKIVYHSKKFN